MDSSKAAALHRGGAGTRNRAGWNALGVIGASLAVALMLNVAACFLPENDYQRWQLVDGTDFENLRWGYERAHFDPRPVDVAIVGSSRSLLGLSAARIAQQLSIRGKPATVANFSVIQSGRNVQWAMVDELLKAKSPKVIVLAIDGTTYLYGHPAFKYVAPAAAIIDPPAALLHNYFKDLTYLPARKLKLFGAWLFPGLLGLRTRFDPEIYAHTRTEYSSGVVTLEGKQVDMERVLPPATLLAQATKDNFTFFEHMMRRCCNDGDDHVYIRSIAQEAQAHGARLLFVYFPNYLGAGQTADTAFLQQYGAVVSVGDLAPQSDMFESWSHLNHAGAVIASDRVARVLAGLGV